MENELDYIGQVKSSDDVAKIAESLGYGNFAEEVVGMFCMNAVGMVIGYHEISHGDLTSSQTHPREIFKRAIINNASSVIIVHNHPSGSTNPSEEDKQTTERLKHAGELLGIPVIDHLIIAGGGKGYCSMKANGMLGV